MRPYKCRRVCTNEQYYTRNPATLPCFVSVVLLCATTIVPSAKMIFGQRRRPRRRQSVQFTNPSFETGQRHQRSRDRFSRAAPKLGLRFFAETPGFSLLCALSPTCRVFGADHLLGGDAVTPARMAQTDGRTHAGTPSPFTRTHTGAKQPRRRRARRSREQAGDGARDAIQTLLTSLLPSPPALLIMAEADR